MKNIKANWQSALSVALVSVPLSLSLGIASGAGPVVGIIAAVWAGLVAGMVGGSQFNIVGPAGALSGILASYALLYSPGILPLVAIIAGGIILAVWLLRWDKYLIFVPSSVVHGFTLGVALTIGFGQLNFALGISGLPAHEHLYQNIFETLSHVGLLRWSSFAVFAVSIAAMFGLARLRLKVPNTVIVAALGIVFGALATKGIVPLIVPTLLTKYGALHLSLFSVPHISLAAITPAIGKAGAVVAFVVILETLLSAKVADGMTKTKCNQRREVLGVGLANIASGIFGGLPASGVFARTSVNVRSGATSQWSQIINAAFVAVIALVFLPYFAFIPLAVIAAILIFAAVRMVNPEHFRQLYKYDVSAFYIALSIAAVTAISDATSGILVGALAALLVFARRVSVTHGHPVISDDETHTYHFAGSLNYLNTKGHADRLMAMSGELIILDFTHAAHIDADGMEGIVEIVEHFEQRGQPVMVRGISEALDPLFALHDWYDELKGDLQATV